MICKKSLINTCKLRNLRTRTRLGNVNGAVQLAICNHGIEIYNTKTIGSDSCYADRRTWVVIRSRAAG
jgi:hypothetical protein